jgi:hypothetical protein
MKIKFGMPELLVLYSFAMYQHSLILSLLTLILGIISSTFCYIQEKDDSSADVVEISKKEIL